MSEFPYVPALASVKTLRNAISVQSDPNAYKLADHLLSELESLFGASVAHEAAAEAVKAAEDAEAK